MKLYIDYIGSKSINGVIAHGGANYTKRVILDLLESNLEDLELILIWPKGYNPVERVEEELYNRHDLKKIQCEEIDDSLEVSPGDVFFFPLLRTKRYPILEKIKEWYPKSKVYLTNHDVRPIDLKPDRYDKYYCGKNYYLINWLKYIAKAYVYKSYLRKFYPYTDKVFSVSNDAVQKIVNIVKVKQISYFYEKTLVEKEHINNNIEFKYILCVSGKVKTKNFARALEAFCRYKEVRTNEMHLVVTGMTDEVFSNILKNPRIDRDIVEKWVVKYPYVEKEFLQDLYAQCTYLLYPSLNEGFGLPVLEAAICGRKSLCSYISSVPEVLGGAVNYINPYNVNDIVNGMIIMENNAEADKSFEEKVNLCKKMGEIDMKLLIHELTH